MLSENEAKNIMVILTAAFPKGDHTTEATLTLYFDRIQKLESFDDAVVGVSQVLDHAKFWPSLAEIVDATRQAYLARTSREASLALEDGRRKSGCLHPGALERLKRLFAADVEGRIAEDDYHDALYALTTSPVTAADLAAVDRVLEAARFRRPENVGPLARTLDDVLDFGRGN